MNTPNSAMMARLRRALNSEFEMSNRTTPAENQSSKQSPESDEMWKTPRKGGYPESSPRSHAMKWMKSEEALLTKFAKFV